MAILCRLLGCRWRCKCGARFPYPHGTMTTHVLPPPPGRAVQDWQPCDEEWTCTRCEAKGERRGAHYA